MTRHSPVIISDRLRPTLAPHLVAVKARPGRVDSMLVAGRLKSSVNSPPCAVSFRDLVLDTPWHLGHTPEMENADSEMLSNLGLNTGYNSNI